MASVVKGNSHWQCSLCKSFNVLVYPQCGSCSRARVGGSCALRDLPAAGAPAYSEPYRGKHWTMMANAAGMVMDPVEVNRAALDAMLGERKRRNAAIWEIAKRIHKGRDEWRITCERGQTRRVPVAAAAAENKNVAGESKRS